MARKIRPDSTWQERIEVLHHDLGVRREDLYEDLGIELRHVWGITSDLAKDKKEVRLRVENALAELFANAEKKVRYQLAKEDFLRSLRVSYYFPEVPEGKDFETGEKRRAWFFRQKGGVAESTVRGYVTQFIGCTLESLLKFIPSELPLEQPEEPILSKPISLEKEPQPTPEPVPAESGDVFTPPEPEDIDIFSFDTKPWSTSEDDALAVLALSRGTRRGLSRASDALCRIFDSRSGLITVDEFRLHGATGLARKRGVNQKEARTALGLMAKRGSPAIAPGRFDQIEDGLHPRIATSTFKSVARKMGVYRAVAKEFQDISREEGGRLDLAGDWTSEAVQNHAEEMVARIHSLDARDVVEIHSFAVLYDGLRRATLEQLVSAHPYALLFFGQAARMFFIHGTPGERAGMAIWLLELVGSPNRHTARGDSKQYISTILLGLREFGITSRDLPVLADQLAKAVGPITTKENFSGADLLEDTRLPR